MKKVKIKPIKITYTTPDNKIHIDKIKDGWVYKVCKIDLVRKGK